MDRCRVRSDYSPDTSLFILRNVDGDICLKIIGDGQMRIATDGGRFHGERLIKVIDAFQNLIDVLSEGEE